MVLKTTATETKYNTGYNSRLEVKHFAVSAVDVGQFAASSYVYLVFKHFEFIKHCFMSSQRFPCIYQEIKEVDYAYR